MKTIANLDRVLDNKVVRIILYYLIFIAFLFPRGGLGYSDIYKRIYTVLIWGSTFIIYIIMFLYFINNYRSIIKKHTLIFLYFVFLILVTVIQRGILFNGYQKLIAFPAILFFAFYGFKRDPKNMLNCVINIILVEFLLNQIVLRDFFEQQYHTCFLGHVQMIAQLGLLGVFCSFLYWNLYNEQKIKIVLTCILVLFTMITTDATSSIGCAIILVVIYIFYKINKYSFFLKDTKFYIIGGVVLSIIAVLASELNNIFLNSKIYALDFSGRGFVWNDALQKIINRPIWGYGVEGVLLRTFWNIRSGSIGFNYAHNQNLQNLLDGGIIAFVLFYIMLIKIFKKVNNVLDDKYKFIINSTLVCFLCIMIFESVSLYCYFYIFCGIAYAMFNVANAKNRSKKNGVNK